MSVNDIALSAAGSSGPATYVEDVFSTYLYTGNGSTGQTISNGIDLSGKGGLVWIKQRNSAENHKLVDTARGATFSLESNTTIAQATETAGLTAFTSSGFSLGGDAEFNFNTGSYASWTFRKQPKFFDVVTYTGDGGGAQTIAHNLGSVPGMIIVKCTSTTGNWPVYHRSRGATERAFLNGSNQFGVNSSFWNDTEPTSTEFTVGSQSAVNASGQTYVAYIFAHNAGGFGAAGTDNVISCGSYTGTNTSQFINLGYEPQWILAKPASSAGDWFIFDNMRGIATGGNEATLFANDSAAELNVVNALSLTATGFELPSASFNNSGTTYIYMAIRRPMKVPTSGTEVFKAVKRAGTGSSTNVTAGFPVDLNITSGIEKNSEVTAPWIDRLRGSSQNFRYLWSSSTNAEAAGTASGVYELTQTGVYTYNTSYNDSTYGDNYVNWMFKRAPGFFDIVCYTGTGSATTQVHNLGVAPELIIVKLRSGGTSWPVYSANLGASNYLFLNLTSSSSTNTTIWDNTTPTASVFNIGTSSFTNSSGGTYVAYLFATCPGVSKVGSYTGNGSSQTIDCGFTAGARFVLIKDVGGGSWYVWDSARGIVAGNDPYLTLNTTNAQNYWGADDDIDPTSSGFIINNTGTNGLNISSGTYIYLAIA